MGQRRGAGDSSPSLHAAPESQKSQFWNIFNLCDFTRTLGQLAGKIQSSALPGLPDARLYSWCPLRVVQALFP